MPCNHWDGLTSFLDERRISLDTNIVERGIRPIVHECKNALFAAMTRRRTGPATAGPQAYFADVLTRLVNLWPGFTARRAHAVGRGATFRSLSRSWQSKADMPMSALRRDQSTRW